MCVTQFAGLAAILSRTLLAKFLARTLAIVLAGFFAMALVSMAAQAQEIEVQGANSIIIANGDATPELDDGFGSGDGTDIGDVSTGDTGFGSFFLVNRSMLTALTINSITITGSHAGDFTVLGFTPNSVIAATGGTTLPFSVQFNPGALALRGPATVTIVSTDAFGNSTYSFAIQGTGVLPPPEITVVGVLSGDTTPSVGKNTDYGQQALNVIAEKAFYIQNLGAANLILTGNPTVSITGSGDFSVITPPITNTAIAGGSQLGVTIRFTPNSPGVKNATVSISNNDTTGGEDPYTFAITGIGATVPEMDVFDITNDIIESGNNPPTLANDTDFGSVVVGGNNPNIFTIRNNGTATLNLTGVSPYAIIGGANAGDFSVTVIPSNTIAAAGSTNMQIRFSPLAVGTRNATVTIANNDPNEDPYTFLITGEGLATPDMRVDGNGVQIGDGDASPHFSDDTDFGSVTLGSNNPNVFTIYNIGTDTLNLTDTSPYVVIGGADAGQFALTSTPGNTIGTGNSTTFAITFTPTSTGTKNATISIANNDPDENPYNFAITGSGAATAPEIMVDGNGNEIFHGATVTSGLGVGEDGTDFGSQEFGPVVTNRNFFISNLGGSPLTVGTVTISGSSNFQVSSQPTGAAIGGGNNTIQIRFVPSGASGLRTAVVSIPNNDPTGGEDPFTFTVSGTVLTSEMRIEGNGVEIVDGDASPSVVDDTDFGAGTSMTYTVYNTGDANLILSDTPPVTLINTGGPGTFSISLANQPSTPVATTNGSTTFTIDFVPGGAGQSTATVSISNNDQDESPYNFTISGGTTPPEIHIEGNGQPVVDATTSVSVGNLTDFGTQAAGGNYPATFRIFNTGTDTLILSSITIGSNDGNFAPLVPPGPINVAGNSFYDLVVDFSPTIPGNVTVGTVTILNNDTTGGEATYTFAVEGTAAPAAPEIAVEGNSTDITDGDSTPSLGDHTGFDSANITNGLVSRVFTIRNTGNVTLNITSIVLGGADVADFTIVGSVPTTVAANNGTQTFTVEFDPTTAGNKVASITINNDDADEGAFDFAISGVGTIPEIEVRGDGIVISSGDFSPQLLDRTDFGSQAIGSNTTYNYSVFNLGSGDLNITGPVTISGTNPGDFAIILQPVSPIATNTALGIRFNPQALGLRTAIITIPNDDSDENPYEFAIQGTGTAAPAPEIEVSGNAVNIVDGANSPAAADHTDFGATDIIGGLISRTFTIDNTGTNTLDIIGVSMSGPDAANFSVTQSPASILAAGNSTTFTVQFDPATVGIKGATITIQNSDADEASFDFAIQGEGTSSGLGSITIIQKITGTDTSVGFTSPTNALNMSLTTIGGTAQSTAIVVGAGIHTITAADLTGAGYGISAIYCDDTNSSGDINTRAATINLSVGETITCTFETVDSREITSGMIRDFLGTRNLILMSNQPDIARRLTRLNPISGPSQGTISASAFGFTARIPSPIDVQISQNMLSFAASSTNIMGEPDAAYPDINNWDIWTEGNISMFDSNAGQNGTMGVVHAGVDYLATKDILVGLRAQVDWMSQEFSATSGRVNGTGWMVGPYAIVRLDENFYFDVSSTWGTSLNYISPFGTYVDEFSTTRWLFDGSLVGEFKIENWTIRPTMSFTYINEYQNAYTDSLNVPIPGQNVANGEIRVGPRVSYTHNLENGSQLVPWAELFGVYNFTSQTPTSANSFSSAMQGFTGSFEAGLDLTTVEGGIVNIAGQYEGIGSGAQAFGVTLGLSAPLN